MDSKSIRNTDTAGEKGYDAGKKISGVKLRLAVDTGGLPQAMKVATADVSGRDGALEALGAAAPNLSKVAKALCDGGYAGEKFAGAVKALLGPGVKVEVVQRNELRMRRAAYVCRIAPAVDCPARLCVAGKKQAPLEKLRAQAPQHAANDGSCVCIPFAEKILNRL